MLSDLSPVLRLAVFGALLSLAPLLWWHLRHRGASLQARLRALTVLTLFLTFDLVVFGAFTRLTDSGLGCPDWPGCYGSLSPIGAHEEISAAQAQMPTGPVTFSKAWIEMIHRYLASAVGVLILVITALSWWAWQRKPSREAMAVAPVTPWWSTFTLVWVCMQGAFGALTVTMKLFPAIVTLHLLGGVGLLMLLGWQVQAMAPSPWRLSAAWRRWLTLLLLLCLVQVSLGAWVSTNYAVLACGEFPTCHDGQWWPEMDFAQGFSLWRDLGATASGAWLPLSALTAIHMAHRLGALLVLPALLLTAWRLRATPAPGKRWAAWLLGLALWQFLSGLSNIVLDWPLLAALAHTAGAAALLTVLSFMLAQAWQGRHAARLVTMAGQSQPAPQHL